MPKSKPRLDSAQVHSEWTPGPRTANWDALWRIILYSVAQVTDIQDKTDKKGEETKRKVDS